MITNTGQAIECLPEKSILHATISVDIEHPYICATASCGTSISAISMLAYGGGALTSAQWREGKILACHTQPCSDFEILWLGRGGRQ